MSIDNNDTKTLQFDIIQCKDHIYIKFDGSNYGYPRPNAQSFLYDGAAPEKTYKDDWFKLPNIPNTVEQKAPDQKTNIRYELKAGYPESVLTPKVISTEAVANDEYEEVMGLYEYKYDLIEGVYESVPFTTTVIYKKDDFEWLQQAIKGKPSLLSEIEYHPDLLQEAPCCMDSRSMYEIIRQYVKEHIDPTVAAISSDYRFHFEVKRRVMLAEPYSQTWNVNAFEKRKKPKWTTKWINSKDEVILNLKSQPSDTDYGIDCQLAPVIYGDNQRDLDEKVNAYLVNLMADINTRYTECSHCKGWGVVKEIEDGTESIQ